MGIFMTATLQAAIHLGNDYVENLHSTKKAVYANIETAIQVTRKFIKDQKDEGISVINFAY